MSSMCGIYRSGEPVEGAQIEAMLQALDYWNADARSSWLGTGIGFGHLLLRTSPEPHWQSLPAFDSELHLAITGDVRLDNRTELAARFGITNDELRNWTDGRLVMRAYHEWHDACAEHLLGDFAFAVWDGPRRQLYCARDPFGIKPFYYSHRDRSMIFASEMKGVLALPDIDRSVDETWVGDYLHHLALDATGTFYSNIRRLAPAHAMTLGAGGLRRWRYWEPDRHRELHFARDDDYIEAFREKLELAIRRRVQTAFAVGAELSGGLDSSGICAIAQQLLRKDGRELQTFSQVCPTETYPGGALPGDARWAIDHLCEHAGLARPCMLTGEGSIIPALEWAARYYDEPPRNTVSLYNDDLYDAAAAGGIRVLLSGFGGNHGVSATAAERQRELLLSGRWIELFRELSTMDSGHRAAAWMRLLLLELPPVVRASFDRIFKKYRLWQKYAYRPTRDDLARRIGMRQRASHWNKLNFTRMTVRDRAAHLLGLPEVPLRLEYAHVSATARRIEYRYPLLDVELVSQYMATPSRLKYWRGVGRYLFRRSLEGWVPDEIRWYCGARASANPGSVLRRRRDSDELQTRLRTLPPDNPLFDYFDPGKLQLERMLWNVKRTGPWERNTELLMALILERKLRDEHGIAGS